MDFTLTRGEHWKHCKEKYKVVNTMYGGHTEILMEEINSIMKIINYQPGGNTRFDTEIRLEMLLDETDGYTIGALGERSMERT